MIESGFNPDPSDVAASRTWVVSGGSGVGLLCSSARAATRDPPTKLDSESSVSSHRMRIPDLLQPPLSGVLSCSCELLSCYLKDVASSSSGQRVGNIHCVDNDKSTISQNTSSISRMVSV